MGFEGNCWHRGRRSAKKRSEPAAVCGKPVGILRISATIEFRNRDSKALAESATSTSGIAFFPKRKLLKMGAQKFFCAESRQEAKLGHSGHVNQQRYR
jgi:hypothetical protein